MPDNGEDLLSDLNTPSKKSRTQEDKEGVQESEWVFYNVENKMKKKGLHFFCFLLFYAIRMKKVVDASLCISAISKVFYAYFQ